MSDSDLSTVGVDRSAVDADLSAREEHASLEFRGICKHYGRVDALQDFNLRVGRNEFVTLLGPSGSGKTTVLRTVAGFLAPTQGDVLVDGVSILGVPPGKRNIGMVFQDYALFPHLNVRDNIMYGLKVRKWDKAKRGSRVDEMLVLIGLEGLADRHPRELSGGQQQRVALARALAYRPKVLLLDEPFGALDRELRTRLAVELRAVHDQFGGTSLFVTHDREEAMTLSDRIAVMRDGGLEAFDSPLSLYRRPSTKFVASFFAGCSLIPGQALDSANLGRVKVQFFDQTFMVATSSAFVAGEELWIAVPESAVEVSAGGMSVGPGIRARVQDLWFVGEKLRCKCVLDDGTLLNALIEASRGEPLRRGDEALLAIDVERLVAVR